MEKMSTNFKDFISGYSIEVVPNSAAKIESFKEILPINTRVYIAHLETENIDEAFRSDLQFGDWKKDFHEQMLECASNFSLEFGREVTADVFTHWAQKSYDNSVFYIENKLNESNLKDSAIIGMVNGLRVEQLSVAVSWAHEISDQSVRQQLLESLATQ